MRLLLVPALAAVAAAQSPRIISFSGYQWTVKNSTNRVGPGPNFFSDSTANVWVDGQGQLHLKIAKRQGKWYCAEIVSVDSFGYGTYRFSINSRVDNIDPNAVLGLFTWNDLPDYNHREIDVEFARWGSAANQNAQYVVQPYTNPLNIFRFNWPADVPSAHSFTWSPSNVHFESQGATGAVLQQRTITSDVPQPGGENARMNLW
ncbi:MAG: glycoside hydrolase family 16 protein, partial [Bryobacteraceae bacterium]